MKSNIRNLIIVAVCVVVLGSALLTLKLTGNDTAESSSAVSTASIELVSKKSEDVVSMNVENAKGSYTLVPVPKVSSSQASSGTSSADADSAAPTYTVKELSGCPINTSAAESAVKNGFSLVASKNLGTVSNLEDFGLQNPQATVKVKFQDGSSYDYRIGKTTATDSSAYYMCGLNSDTVYVVAIDQGLLEGAEYFVSTQILSITNQAGANNFSKITLSGAHYPQPVTFSAHQTALRISSPAVYTADSTALSNLESSLASLTADSVAAVHPDAAALKQYGFDSPTAVAQYSVNGGNYKLTAGKQDGSSVYVMLDGVDVVYKVSSSSVEAWALQNLFSLRNKTILAPGIETVQSLTLTAGDSKNVLNLTRAKDESKSTEDTTYYNYKVTGNDGVSLDYDTNYTNFYQTLTGVTVLQDAQEKPAGSAALTVTYRYFDDSKTDTVQLIKSGDRRYTAVLNGQVLGIVTQDDLDGISSALTALESGKAVG
ncbi:MAG: DUF4340 domain-containing protein [Oscillospiraceae bacterium]|jgi:hypothetical protein|nr:DUF4340 domain-containing protein [Oscillospiraceae bacterium]